MNTARRETLLVLIEKLEAISYDLKQIYDEECIEAKGMPEEFWKIRVGVKMVDRDDFFRIAAINVEDAIGKIREYLSKYDKT